MIEFVFSNWEQRILNATCAWKSLQSHVYIKHQKQLEKCKPIVREHSWISHCIQWEEQENKGKWGEKSSISIVILIGMYIMGWVGFAEEYDQVLNSAVKPNPVFLLILSWVESFCMELRSHLVWCHGSFPTPYGWCSLRPSLPLQKATSLCYNTQTFLHRRHQEMFTIR